MEQFYSGQKLLILVIILITMFYGLVLENIEALHEFELVLINFHTSTEVLISHKVFIKLF